MIPPNDRNPVVFEAVLKTLLPMMMRHAERKPLPWLGPEETLAEMMMAYWRAWQSYDVMRDPEKGYKTWAWTVWLNRKRDLYEKYYLRQKTTRLMTPEEMESFAGLLGLAGPMEEHFDSPVPLEHRAAQVWELVLLGFRAVEIMEILNISRRKYYDVIAQLKASPDMRGHLLAY